MIRAKDLRVTLDGMRILDGVSLEILAGAWLSIIGPNGAGKSTLLRAFAGAVRSSGGLEIAGNQAAGMKRRQRSQQIAWVPQTPIIPLGMRVIDYVLLGRTPHVHPLLGERPDDIDVVRSVLTDLDLDAFASRIVDTLSGGERQRVVIARALAQQSPILLLDEPTTALDLGHQQEVLALLDRLRADGSRTIVTTMHDLTLAGQYADRLVLLSGGRVVAAGGAHEVLTTSNLAEHYAADVRVHHDEDGAVVILPARKSTNTQPRRA